MKIWRIFLSLQETLQDCVTRIASTDCKNPRLLEYLHDHAISLVLASLQGHEALKDTLQNSH